MNYYSLNKKSPNVNFSSASVQGQAPDKGLYFPCEIPKFDKDLINNIENISNEEIAYRAIKPYIGNSISESDLFQIVEETISFPIPVKRINESIYSLELFHGPTLAFKDIGARFMSRCLGQFAKQRNEKMIVLVATSGDTGAAVANAFYKVDGVEVVILYPKDKVSLVQEKQLTTCGENIKALRVDGNFDDCQQMVKNAFADETIIHKLFLTSANSINIARWLPQQFYYLFAYKQWSDKKNLPIICVPSGNFGNICAGILAYASGLPIKKFIAACNANDTIPDYLNTGIYNSKNAVATISNAMDIGSPNNFVRILEILSNDFKELKNLLLAYSISDDETRNTIKEVYKKYNYLLDPHGAVAYASLEKYQMQEKNSKGIVLETAHPIKFNNIIEPLVGFDIEIPKSISDLLLKQNICTNIGKEYDELKNYLLKLL
jgi:threonine synthase